MRPDYQSTLGFELVELEPKDDADHFYPDCVVREDGADDRDATITERVLWNSLVETLTALRDLLAVAPSKPPAAGLIVGIEDKHRAAIAAARAALKSNGWSA